MCIFVYIAPVSEFANAEFNTPEFLKAELGRVAAPVAPLEKRAAYGLLAHALERHFCLDIAQLTKDAQGKPLHPNCHVSLSHSHGLAVAAAADIPVGLDIERVDAARFTPALAARIAAKGESPAKNADEFFTLWTVKEAAAKLSGRGIADMRRPIDAHIAVRTVKYGSYEYRLAVATEQYKAAELMLLGGVK